MEPSVVESARLRPEPSSIFESPPFDLAGLASMAGNVAIPATGWGEVRDEALRLVAELVRLLRGLRGGDDNDVPGVVVDDCHDLVRELDCRVAERSPLSTEIDEAREFVCFLDLGF